jgi:Kazal-type serine protease inhibitor domain
MGKKSLPNTQYADDPIVSVCVAGIRVSRETEGLCQRAMGSKCSHRCSKDSDPVCGVDGRTYLNKCMMRVETCRLATTHLSHYIYSGLSHSRIVTLYLSMGDLSSAPTSRRQICSRQAAVVGDLFNPFLLVSPAFLIYIAVLSK